MAAESGRPTEPAESIDAAVYDDRRAEVGVEHNPEQTVVAVETQDGRAAAAVDVGHLSLETSLQLARDVREVFERATTRGGESADGE